MRRALAALLLLAAAGPARAEEPLTLGVYLPDAALEVNALSELASTLATQLGAATGTRLVPRPYRKEEDFLAALDAGRLDWALCEPLLVATRGLRVVAVASSGERTTTQLALYTPGGARPPALIGKRLAGPRTARHAQLYDNVLFEGELAVQKSFTWLGTPDATSALEVVRAGRADVAIAPAGLRVGLKELAIGPPIPNPALVAISSRRPELVAAVRAALGRIALKGPYSGLRPAAPRAYQALAAELRAARKPWLLLPPRPPAVPLSELAPSTGIRVDLPSLDRLIGLD